MVIPTLIERKRDGAPLSPEEWRSLIGAYVAGEVPDYQMAALLMAVFFRGLEPAELEALTEAMLASGRRLDLPASGARWWTSTRRAAWATRPRCCSRRCWPPAAAPCP